MTEILILDKENKNSEFEDFTLEEFIEFLDKTHKAVKDTVFSIEAGYNPYYVGKVKRGEIPFSRFFKEKVYPIMKKYGFNKK